MSSYTKPITKNKQRFIILGVVGGIASAMALLSGLFFGADNPVEEVSEEVVEYAIKQSTGADINIDFSPQK